MKVKMVGATIVLAGSLGAGAQMPGGAPPQGPGGARPRDEAFKMVEAYFISNLQESLGLSDEQFVKLLPAVKKAQSERRDQMERRGRAVFQMRNALKSGKATETVVIEGLKELKKVEIEGPPALHKLQEAIDAQLSPLQQAKYRLTEMEVERKVREILMRGARPREGRRPALRGDQAPGQPGPEDDEP